MNFDIKTEQLGPEAYVISLAGEVDLYTAPEFKQQLLEVIGQGGKHVIVDFTSTTFIDSTTLGVLVGGVVAHATSLTAVLLAGAVVAVALSVYANLTVVGAPSPPG